MKIFFYKYRGLITLLLKFITRYIMKYTLPWERAQPWKGSPCKPTSHAQVARWSTTEHTAPGPQACSQGSLHRWATHARAAGHSALIVHSGRQFGGDPMYPGWQLQAGVSPVLTHIELGPQGEGWQGSSGIGAGAKKIFSHEYKFKIICFKITEVLYFIYLATDSSNWMDRQSIHHYMNISANEL